MTEQQEGSACNFSPANESGSIVVSMSDPNQWSDWNGQRGSNPAVTEAFLEAIQKVQTIGGRSVSVRADVLNLFDNPLFTTLQSQFGTPTFGQLTAVGGYARSVQFQVRFGW